MSSDLTPTPRDELRARIEASERRIAQRTLADQAQEAAEAAVEYTRKNPLTVIAGAVAVGLVVGAMTSPGRRVVRTAATGAASAASAVGGTVSGAAKGVGDAAKKRGSAIGALVTDAVVAYGIKLIDEALDGARAGQDKFEDISDSASAKARELRRDAAYYAGTASDKGRAVTQRTRRRAERAVRDLTDRIRN